MLGKVYWFLPLLVLGGRFLPPVAFFDYVITIAEKWQYEEVR